MHVAEIIMHHVGRLIVSTFWRQFPEETNFIGAWFFLILGILSLISGICIFVFNTKENAKVDRPEIYWSSGIGVVFIVVAICMMSYPPASKNQQIMNDIARNRLPMQLPQENEAIQRWRAIEAQRAMEKFQRIQRNPFRQPEDRTVFPLSMDSVSRDD